ncbi:MAG: TolC family protein, partial [Methyloceanibacter sp.]
MAATLCAPPAASETLDEALANAYLINPALAAERARARATDEQVAIAKSGLRPNISATGDVSFRNTESDIAGGSRGDSQQCSDDVAALEPAFCASLDAGQANFGQNGDITSDGVTHPRGYSVGLS